MNVEFLVTSIVVILLPGTGVIYTIAIGLGRGVKASIRAAFGCTLGIVPHIFVSIVGLAAVLHTSALIFQLIKYLGVAYLFYMASNILREHGVLDISQQQTETDSKSIIRNGILLNVLNPKLSLFFLAFLPQFLAPGITDPTLALLGLALTFMLMTFIIFICYGACTSLARDYVISRPAVLVWFRRSFASVFGLLGLRLALSDSGV